MFQAVVPAPFQSIVLVHIYIGMHLEPEDVGLEMLAEIGVALADELILGITHQLLCLMVKSFVRIAVLCRHAHGHGFSLLVTTMEGLDQGIACITCIKHEIVDADIKSFGYILHCRLEGAQVQDVAGYN